MEPISKQESFSLIAIKLQLFIKKFKFHLVFFFRSGTHCFNNFPFEIVWFEQFKSCILCFLSITIKRWTILKNVISGRKVLATFQGAVAKFEGNSDKYPSFIKSEMKILVTMSWHFLLPLYTILGKACQSLSFPYNTIDHF